jgi:hypothetical protein
MTYVAIPTDLLARLDDYLEDRQDANVDGGILVADHEMILLRDLRLDCDKQLVDDLLQACDYALDTLIGCCVPAGGVDDRQTILDTQAMLRAAIAKAKGV